jgi:hypothetical protein
VSVGPIVTANQKPVVEAGGDSLIDLSDEVAPSVTAGEAASVPSLNTKLAGLGMFTC